MKKKSLLIAMAAMSVAAIGAGTVSTMAWFSVDAASTSEVAATSGAFSVVDEYAAAGGVIFQAVIGDVTEPTNGLDLSNNWGNTKYKTGSSELPYANDIEDTYVIVPIKVQVKDSASSQPFANKIATLAGDKVSINITGSLVNSDSTDASAALKYKLDTAPTRGTDDAVTTTWATESVTGIKEQTISGSEEANSYIIAEFNLYVGIDGTNSLANNKLAEQDITITVTPVYTAA